MKIVKSENHVYEFSPAMIPVLEVAPGERVVFETHDCFAGQISSEEDLCTGINFDYVNPATGPVAVSGAEKGDLLGVRIEDIEVGERAFAVLVPGAGVLPERVTAPVTKLITAEAGEGTCSFGGFTLPLKPMVGVIGVAPAGEGVSTGTPGAHGGNMDTRDIKKGSVVWFPVNVKGAMLALGDCHAAMGDGEVGCSGAEIPAKVTVSTELLKNASSSWPIIVTGEEIMIVASEDSLDLAARSASETMADLAAKSLGLSFEDSLILCSLAMDLRISQVVDPKKTVRAALPLAVLPWGKARIGLGKK
ncbi:MAG: acetamidase/formamidase family protein [Aminivibrio sp.]|jgi:amidase